MLWCRLVQTNAGAAVDYDLDTETRMRLYEERQRRISQQRRRFGQLAYWSVGLSLVTIVVTVTQLLG